MLSKGLVDETYGLIKDHVCHTPLQESIYLSTPQRRIFFKNEGLQYTKSFKLRGATSKVLRLTEEEKKKGLMAISSGNHGIAVAYLGHLLGLRVTIFVPETTPQSKCEKITKFGADLIKQGTNYDQAHEVGMAYLKSHDVVFIDSYDKDPLIYAGQGTIGYELYLDRPDLTAVLVPIGGGGMVTGIATYLKAVNPHIKIIGVQTQACPAMLKSIEDQTHYKVYPNTPSHCEALVGGIGHLAFKHRHLIDDVLLVKESTIEKAITHMLLKEKIVAEPSACVGIAALMDHPTYDFGNQVALVVSGNNIDEDLMFDMLAKSFNR